jgi:glucose/arabinose dehydrogenase
MYIKRLGWAWGIVTLLAVACGGSATQTPTMAPATVANTPTETVTAAATAAATHTSVATQTAAPSATAQTTQPPQSSPTTPPTEAAPATSPATPASGQVSLRKVVDGLEPLTYLTHAGEGSERLYLVVKAGRILVLENGSVREQPFLDISDRVGSQGSEQGLLSIAFSPRYSSDNAFYVNYTDTKGDTVVSRFSADRQQVVADADSEMALLNIDQPFANHNGGQLQFGPDGMLYIGMGDGGSGGDPQNNGQNTGVLLGKLLRIDVNQTGQPYAIPADNPKLGNASRPEVWAYGLRNPWRFSFDRQTGDLYIADVGQNQYEEIDFHPAGTPGGQNYGWNLREGFESYSNGADSASFTAPIHEYSHADGCSVTGGYVYRGQLLPQLNGAYLYSDYCSGHIWALQRAADGTWQNTLLLESGTNVSSFGEDAAGELYVIGLDGSVFQFVAGQ